MFFKNKEIVKANLNGSFSNNKKLNFTINTNDNNKITTLYIDKAEPIVKRYKFINFKPFVYALALENNYTPSSLVLDAPLVLAQGSDLKMWKPENYGKKFYGPSTLRIGLEKSRNLMTGYL